MCCGSSRGIAITAYSSCVEVGHGLLQFAAMLPNPTAARDGIGFPGRWGSAGSVEAVTWWPYSCPANAQVRKLRARFRNHPVSVCVFVLEPGDTTAYINCTHEYTGLWRLTAPAKQELSKGARKMTSWAIIERTCSTQQLYPQP